MYFKILTCHAIFVIILSQSTNSVLPKKKSKETDEIKHTPAVIREIKWCEDECKDNKNFRSKTGATCKDWEGSDCKSPIWKLSTSEEQLLLENCCNTCRLCEESQRTSKIYIRKIPQNHRDCNDDPNYIDSRGFNCNDWKGFHCHSAQKIWFYTKKQENDLLKHCAETCKICKNTFLKLQDPLECQFPFIVEGRQFNNCIDARVLNPETLQYQKNNNQKSILEDAWCPVQLTNDKNYNLQLPWKRCYNKNDKKSDYKLCNSKNDCKSNICKIHSSDGRKRCHPSHTKKRSCKVGSKYIYCTYGDICNPHGDGKFIIDSITRYDRKKKSFSKFFEKGEKKLLRFYYQKEKALQYERQPCFPEYLSLLPYEKATRNKYICIGVTETLSCDIGTYCFISNTKTSCEAVVVPRTFYDEITGALTLTIALFFPIALCCVFLRVCTTRSIKQSKKSVTLSTRLFCRELSSWISTGLSFQENKVSSRHSLPSCRISKNNTNEIRRTVSVPFRQTGSNKLHKSDKNDIRGSLSDTFCRTPSDTPVFNKLRKSDKNDIRGSLFEFFRTPSDTSVSDKLHKSDKNDIHGSLFEFCRTPSDISLESLSNKLHKSDKNDIRGSLFEFCRIPSDTSVSNKLHKSDKNDIRGSLFEF